MKARYLSLRESAGVDFADAIFSHVLSTQRQLWLAAA